jgi:hypothetical protein
MLRGNLFQIFCSYSRTRLPRNLPEKQNCHAALESIPHFLFMLQNKIDTYPTRKTKLPRRVGIHSTLSVHTAEQEKNGHAALELTSHILFIQQNKVTTGILPEEEKKYRTAMLGDN